VAHNSSAKITIINNNNEKSAPKLPVRNFSKRIQNVLTQICGGYHFSLKTGFGFSPYFASNIF